MQGKKSSNSGPFERWIRIPDVLMCLRTDYGSVWFKM